MKEIVGWFHRLVSLKARVSYEDARAEVARLERERIDEELRRARLQAVAKYKEQVDKDIEVLKGNLEALAKERAEKERKERGNVVKVMEKLRGKPTRDA